MSVGVRNGPVLLLLLLLSVGLVVAVKVVMLWLLQQAACSR